MNCEICNKETNGNLWWLCKDHNGDYGDFVCVCDNCDDKQTKREENK